MSEYPSISCVVIGLNCEKTILECLTSITESHPVRPFEIIYADGGSSDNSVALALSVPGVRVLELKLDKPTPGKGRNAGWRAATGEWVQFLDSDTVMDKEWLFKATSAINSRAGAIYGWRKEKYPQKNCLHFIADLEWLRPQEDAHAFGGDVLIRRSVLEETGGYDDTLVGGEDPELAIRVREKGWQIRGVDALMCFHDIDMRDFSGYWKRSYRSGYAYAEAGLKMLAHGDSDWIKRTARITMRCMLVLTGIPLLFLTGSPLCLALVAAAVLLPLKKAGYFKTLFRINLSGGLLYAAHCSVVAWPQFYGIVSYFTVSAAQYFARNFKERILLPRSAQF